MYLLNLYCNKKFFVFFERTFEVNNKNSSSFPVYFKIDIKRQLNRTFSVVNCIVQARLDVPCHNYIENALKRQKIVLLIVCRSIVVGGNTVLPWAVLDCHFATTSDYKHTGQPLQRRVFISIVNYMLVPTAQWPVMHF